MPTQAAALQNTTSARYIRVTRSTATLMRATCAGSRSAYTSTTATTSTAAHLACQWERTGRIGKPPYSLHLCRSWAGGTSTGETSVTSSRPYTTLASTRMREASGRLPLYVLAPSSAMQYVCQSSSQPLPGAARWRSPPALLEDVLCVCMCDVILTRHERVSRRGTL